MPPVPPELAALVDPVDDVAEVELPALAPPVPVAAWELLVP
jgi:hypothetical protein